MTNEEKEWAKKQLWEIVQWQIGCTMREVKNWQKNLQTKEKIGK
jgi:hypothetical protein